MRTRSTDFSQIAKLLLEAERTLDKSLSVTCRLSERMSAARTKTNECSTIGDSVMMQVQRATTVIEAAQHAMQQAHRGLLVLHKGARHEHGGIYGCLGAHGLVAEGDGVHDFFVASPA